MWTSVEMFKLIHKTCKYVVPSPYSHFSWWSLVAPYSSLGFKGTLIQCHPQTIPMQQTPYSPSTVVDGNVVKVSECLFASEIKYFLERRQKSNRGVQRMTTWQKDKFVDKCCWHWVMGSKIFFFHYLLELKYMFCHIIYIHGKWSPYSRFKKLHLHYLTHVDYW